MFPHPQLPWCNNNNIKLHRCIHKFIFHIMLIVFPYRQFLSPVYVPHMVVPGYSNSAPYPHPTNGNYVLMPRGGSHLNANNLKYGVQQFKPVPAGNPTGFGNFANPAGYAMLAPGVVGGASGLEDSSRVKYKDNLYVPNLQKL
ncbi:uncharacterized protein LOC127108040 isoform X2 [Lathyrus oleraceus]|uniref:uncharacterized protein LOC127108040 isoform X2 n=1 Tax=Pisum sativum TaxID=3888 RepID=UPI0021D395C7|nr:uncharacterized protein LOC127108040 isoform X2 [Pisum sativum]